MALTETQKTRANIVRKGIDVGAFTKPEIDAALASLETSLTRIFNAVNRDLPEPFKTQATPAQKRRLFAFYLLRKIGRARVRED